MVGRPQQRAQQTRKEILEVAAAAFAEGGYEGTSLNTIVAKSRLTKGAFYHHFASKEDLALACFGYKQEQLLARLAAAAASEPDALSAMLVMSHERLEALKDDPSSRVVLRLGAVFRAQLAPNPTFVALQERPFEALTALVRRGQADGTLRPNLNPRATAEVIFGAMMGVDDVSHFLGEEVPVSRSELLIELLLDGLTDVRARNAAKGKERA